MVHDDNDRFSPQAYSELNDMFEKLFVMLDEAFEYLGENNVTEYEHIIVHESELDKMEYDARKNHFKRMVNKECTGAVASSVYADMLSNLERMGDHCCNIARYAFEHRN